MEETMFNNVKGSFNDALESIQSREMRLLCEFKRTTRWRVHLSAWRTAFQAYTFNTVFFNRNVLNTESDLHYLLKVISMIQTSKLIEKT
jgi:hypothetical protein